MLLPLCHRYIITISAGICNCAWRYYVSHLLGKRKLCWMPKERGGKKDKGKKGMISIKRRQMKP